MPTLVLDYMNKLQPSKSLLFVVFILAAALFTGIIFAWALSKHQNKTTKTMAGALTMLGTALWAFIGATPEESFLVFLPVCISVSIICSTLQHAVGHALRLQRHDES